MNWEGVWGWKQCVGEEVTAAGKFQRCLMVRLVQEQWYLVSATLLRDYVVLCAIPQSIHNRKIKVWHAYAHTYPEAEVLGGAMT